MIDDALAFARAAWPLGFTKPEIEIALGQPVSIMGLIKLRAIENTGVRRKHGKQRCVVWRYKPYQLKLPFEGGSDARREEKDT